MQQSNVGCRFAGVLESSTIRKVRRRKHLGEFGDAVIIVCCMKLQEQQQADGNYRVRGNVYTKTLTLPFLHYSSFFSCCCEVFFAYEFVIRHVISSRRIHKDQVSSHFRLNLMIWQCDNWRIP